MWAVDNLHYSTLRSQRWITCYNVPLDIINGQISVWSSRISFHAYGLGRVGQINCLLITIDYWPSIDYD